MRQAFRITIATLALALFALAACSVPSTPGTTPGPDSQAASALQVPTPKAGRTRPLIVVLADNAGTETTDFVIPYGVLKESRVADVLAVSTEPGTIKLMPALQVRADTTTAEFDASTPDGADILIVPAMHRTDRPSLLAWVRAQSAKGALVVSICDGAWILANAGLLRDRMATSHWYSLSELKKQNPNTTWVRNRRYVIDRNVMTTTGVSASIPASLALVDAIAGRAAADATAKRLGVATWGPEHDSAPFGLSAGRVAVAVANLLSFWGHETVEVPVEDGFDEIGVALTADAWSRTYRSEAAATSIAAMVRSRRGLLLIPAVASRPGQQVLTSYTGASATALDVALENIASRYGVATADFVALQLEYPER
ncbi:Transcriptional regulator, AraC family [Pseudomonas batumici]|uniref:Transcriptional regulator, AraC family n=2 Tax=Pseudomonas batumici TaxID=226910 RepID=A0A0C2IGJ5_9PSED|nr:Transcriptional regulator, AraC family [Pseudomonas batumici]